MKGRFRGSERSHIKDRIYGCLLGVAAGDAMGMPTSLMSPEAIRKTFGGFIADFLPAPEGHVIHGGMGAGQVTDDTQQTLLLAESLLDRRGVDPRDIARRLVDWAETSGAFDSLLLGPSSLRALGRIRAGVPVEQSGSTGDTNGASMRIASVGIYGRGDLDRTVEAVSRACLPTHNTNIAIAGASAVAMVIGSAVLGVSGIDELVRRALEAAELGMTRGNPWFGASIRSRTELALEIVSRGGSRAQKMRELYDTVGAGVATTETVPLCLGIFKLAAGDPVEAIQIAVNLGGDCDTTASIVGGMCGSRSGSEAIPAAWVATLESVNRLGLDRYAERLGDLVIDSFRA